MVDGRWFCGNGAGGGTARLHGCGGAACDPSYSLWQIGTHHDWFPLPGLRFAVDVLYTGVESTFAGQTITLGKATGARPTGVYTAKDLGILSVMFRAQRTWGAD